MLNNQTGTGIHWHTYGSAGIHFYSHAERITRRTISYHSGKELFLINKKLEEKILWQQQWLDTFCNRLACCIRLYACQLLLALASEIPACSEPFKSAPNKMIFNLSPLSSGLQKENQGACHAPFLNYLFSLLSAVFIITAIIHPFLNHILL